MFGSECKVQGLGLGYFGQQSRLIVMGLPQTHVAQGEGFPVSEATSEKARGESSALNHTRGLRASL